MHQEKARTVVSVEGLVKVFGDQRALDGVDLLLSEGVVTALIGENGSGKSTLIKCLTGVYTPDGRDQLNWMNGADARSCVVVHQDVGLIPGLTVAENFGIGIGFSRGIFGRIAWRRHNRRVAELLAAAGVDVEPTQKIDDLSVAQKTTVAIARALASADDAVRLVILDEPTAALPSGQRFEVLATVRRLAAQGIAVLYVSHHLDEIVEIADRVVILKAGAVAHSIDNTADLDADKLLTLMSGQLQNHDANVASLSEAVVLEVDALTTSLLDGVSFSLHKGEIVGLAGPLDSGGGDVCRALAGLLDYSGELRVDGVPLRALSIKDSIRRGIYLVPSDRRKEGIIADLTVAENLSIAAMRRSFILAPLSKSRLKAAVAETMELLDIRPRDPDRKLGMLSGGNQQKVVLARSLEQRPVILILENPTQGVDPGARLQIRHHIRQAAAAGVSILVSDSDEAEVFAIADRVLHIENGLVVSGTSALS
ncbi:MAG: sugar transporter ATP-binding protein [Microbacteriaceae bacterium]|nr:sugar transporter ATP-binding protein [Microbacteriaceae bacterium]